MKIDFSRLDALRPTAAVPEGFEPVPEAETPFDSGYEAMYRAAWNFHLETDDRLRAAAGEAREEIWLRAAAAMGEKVAAFPDQPFAAALFAAGRSWRDDTRGDEKKTGEICIGIQKVLILLMFLDKIVQ